MNQLSDNSTTADLLLRAELGEQDAIGELFAQHRERLKRLVQLRLDRRMQGRLDASDVLQESYLEYSRSLAAYLRAPPMPFYLWLRTLTGRKLHVLHRRHLGAQVRDAGREISIFANVIPPASSMELAGQLLGDSTSPSQMALRVELQSQVHEALASLDAGDQEILALRHFERLSNAEAAQVLQLSESAASNRFMRALKRVKALLAHIPGLMANPPNIGGHRE